MKNITLLKIITVVSGLALLLAAGCIGGSRSKPSRFYTLDAMDSRAAAAHAAAAGSTQDLRIGIVPVKIMVEADQLKMYVGERKIAETSRVSLGRSDKIYFFLDSLPPDNLTYIGNIRIAAIE